eukprot:COSAG04_NODE_288_length_17855_cov_32.496621_4_plen_243_part_00
MGITVGGGEFRNESTQVHCLVDGEHEHNHDLDDLHSIEVVGYAESGVQQGAGNITAFVIGDCTDTIIRVTTASAGTDTITWSINDDFHNGPWVFETAGSGTFEHVSCMFDNHFSLTNDDESWQGTVEVVGYIQYHGTIEIPVDETWIIQGAIGQDDFPVVLPARLVSGTPLLPSVANIVVRHVRFTGEVAAETPFEYPFRWISFAAPRVGGAFLYDGGALAGETVPKIVFDQVIFDHCQATA